MNIKQIYKYHNLKPQKDFACAEISLFSITISLQKNENWFLRNIKITLKLSVVEIDPYLIMKCSSGQIKILEYKFQALWLYEMTL